MRDVDSHFFGEGTSTTKNDVCGTAIGRNLGSGTVRPTPVQAPPPTLYPTPRSRRTAQSNPVTSVTRKPRLDVADGAAELDEADVGHQVRAVRGLDRGDRRYVVRLDPL